MLEPGRTTNNVGQARTITATVTTNGIPVSGVFVSFIVVSGPSTGANDVAGTDANGEAIFSYSAAAPGTNILQAGGTVNGVPFTCLATQVWRVAAAPPAITCPGNIVTNVAEDGCTQVVAFAPIASGSPMPAIRCRIGNETITSPHLFPAGVSTVICTASNANGSTSCSFTVTVTDSEPPVITCPPDMFVSALPGEGGAVVEFDTPAVGDNCTTVVCNPPSGSTFPLGETFVECTATDAAGNTNTCFFAVFVEETQPEAHDLAVVKIKAPRVVNLSSRSSIQTKRVAVTIQNRSPHIETIFDLQSLVTLTVESLDPNLCSDIVPVLLERRPQRRLPVNLRPRQKLKVYFDVTFDCAVNPAKGFGQEDFRYTAQVHHESLDGGVTPDTHPECDVCPRPPLEGFFDPNPNGRIRDKGCGAPIGDGTFGNDVLTDVVFR